MPPLAARSSNFFPNDNIASSIAAIRSSNVLGGALTETFEDFDVAPGGGLVMTTASNDAVILISIGLSFHEMTYFWLCDSAFRPKEKIL